MFNHKAIRVSRLRKIVKEHEMNFIDNERPVECARIWKEFFERYRIVTNGPDSNEDVSVLDNWEKYSEDWINRFMKLHDIKRLRIYEHILLFHGKALYLKHGPLRWLSNQVCSSTYFEFIY